MNQLKLGDKVRFVNESMEGIVTSLKDKNLVGVTVEDDFEIPVMASELVKIKFEEKAGNNQPELPTAKAFKGNSIHPLGVFFAFDRVGEDGIELFVHNNLAEWVILNVFQKEDGVYHLWQQLKLEREETLLLGKYKFSSIQEWKTLLVQMLPVESHTVKPGSLVQTELNFGVKKFHQWLKHCFFLNRQAYMLRLDEVMEPLNLKALAQRDFTETPVSNVKNLKDKPASIIDLHYEALQQNGYGTASDITAFQMDVFTQTLDAAFVHQLKEIVYIHGVGNAYLKNKIRTWLSKHPEIVSGFEEADLLQFGNGATLVRLR
jgi:hypothetical protein